MIKKVFFISIVLILAIAFVFANQNNVVYFTERKVDIPTPLNPNYVNQIENCGKLDLIDRSSNRYNPNALIDGSLDECGN